VSETIQLVSEVNLMDRIKYLKSVPDNFFDLAIDDPPYGIGRTWSKSRTDRFYRYNKLDGYVNNKIPSAQYFNLLRLKSKNQIIWGGNYFTKFLPPTNAWIVWDKNKGGTKNPMSDCELAWTNYTKVMRIVRLTWDGIRKCEPITKIHPHQKPVKLYKWCLFEYAKLSPASKIFDGHCGSGSSRIAAYDLNYNYYATEIDKKIYHNQQKRFVQHCSQLTL